MHSHNSILIHAPRQQIFEVTSDLARWPELLPHYRYINFLERGDNGLTSKVEMACYRGVMPISWVSNHEIKPDTFEQHFHHLKAFTKGMHVVWTYQPEGDDAVRVTILHDLKFRIRPLAPVMEPLLARGFIEPVAGKTLATFKQLLEAEAAGGPPIR
jgi:ribosome-associated toxin RatA of RatAB toxin-antitoxin module